jgi:hypothetical protein
MELIAYTAGLILSVFLSLPPPLQVGLLVAAGWLWSYKRGWNAAVDAVWVADITKANEQRQARRK